MFSEQIALFSSNLAALREFVAVIRPFLEQHHINTVKSNLPSFGPLVPLLGTQLADTMAKAFGWGDGVKNTLMTEAEIEYEADGKTVKSLKFDSQRFMSAMEAFRRASLHVPLLYRSALVSLTNAAEWFVCQMIHRYCKKYPDALIEKADKAPAFTFDDLKKFSTIDDARQHYVAQRIENVLRGSFDDWAKFLQSHLRLSLGYLDGCKDEIVEVFQRRNLIVHNGGIVNSIYRSNVADRFKTDAVIGKDLPITQQYLDHVIDMFQACFTLMALELWKNQEPADQTRGDVLTQVAFESICEERWITAEKLCFFGRKDARLSEVARIRAELNYWQTLKWQGRYEEVRAEVENADYSAKDEVYQLGLFALKSDLDALFSLADKTIQRSALGIDVFDNWPIFREMRAHAGYATFKQKHTPAETTVVPTVQLVVKGEIETSTLPPPS